MEDSVLINLLKIFHKIPTKLDRDIFGKIYEYFLGKFAMSEGQRGGEFFTPTSIVRLIVEVLEPYHGRILDPACGSGGMFVQSAEFVKDHLKNPYKEISLYGQDRVVDTVRLCKMNLAIHGLSGDVKQGNTYYEDVFNMQGKFDFAMANPPFNVNNVDKEAVKDDPRYLFGIPTVDNANYLWIQIFYFMLNEKGRAGFVMANSAGDARYSELEIRKKLIKKSALDVVISVASNFFYTVTLAVTLWFLKKGDKNTVEKDKVLFIDARKIFRQIDRAHREFTPQQIEFISNIVRLYRGQKIETAKCSSSMIKEYFQDLVYQDVKGLCKVVAIDEIRKQGWSLNPGRYIGVKVESVGDVDFKKKIRLLYDELIQLNANAKRCMHASSLKELYPKERIVMTGPFGSKLHAYDYRAEGVPLILVKHVKNGGIMESDIPKVGVHKFPELNKYLLKTGDIVVTRVGYVGYSAYIDKRYENWLFSGQMLRIRLPDFTILHPKFLSYQFQTYEFRKKIENYAVGTTRLSLNTKILEEVEISVPPIDVQSKIVNVLSLFDDLIEVNFRRIEILEEIAQSSFNEWFVYFRFPGHEKDRIINSEFGKVPEGWQAKKIKDICSFVSRGVTPEYRKGSGRYIINQKANRGLHIERSYLKELHACMHWHARVVEKRGV